MGYFDLLKQIPLFSEMDEREIEEVLAITNTRQYVAGQVIIYEGEPGNLFHIIIEGRAEFVSQDPRGGELILDSLEPGGYFGELLLISSGSFAVKVRAIDNLKTLTLSREEFYEFLLKHPHAAIDVLTVLGRRLHNAESVLRQSMSRNVNIEHDEQLTAGQRIADKLAAAMGSWSFIIWQSVILVIWVVLNSIAWLSRWDPYPFILLNLVLSFQAAYASPIIMMSQNRQADKDRLAAEIDHEVNVRAEIKAGALASRLNDLEKGIHELHKQHMDFIANHSLRIIT